MLKSGSESNLMTVDEAREAVISHLHTGKGGKCAVCLQTVKPYTLNVLSATNREVLRLLARHEHGMTPNQLMTDRASIRRRRNWSALRMTGLVEKKDGVWRITRQGRKLLDGKATVPRSIKVYDNHMLSQSEDRIRF